MNREKSSSNPGNLGAYMSRETVRQRNDRIKKKKSLLNKRGKKRKKKR